MPFYNKRSRQGIVRSRDANEGTLLRAHTRLREKLSLVEMSVYKKDQQYRTLGSTNMNKGRLLRLVTDLDSIDWATSSRWTFASLCYSVEQWVGCLVTKVSDSIELLTVRPSDYMTLIGQKVMFQNLYRGRQRQKGHRLR